MLISKHRASDDRFRGFWLAESQNLPFPIDLQHSHYRVRCDRSRGTKQIGLYITVQGPYAKLIKNQTLKGSKFLDNVM